ncbi:hypothetical protein FOPE_07738 [Fonsecaea pedrosoi]|nr:hypothetical protein FOPE_07738 [Fonsecaea pedrosoi]
MLSILEETPAAGDCKGKTSMRDLMAVAGVIISISSLFFFTGLDAHETGDPEENRPKCKSSTIEPYKYKYIKTGFFWCPSHTRTSQIASHTIDIRNLAAIVCESLSFLTPSERIS